MSESHQPPEGAPQPQYVGPAYAPPQKKSNAWKWVLGILGGLVLLCGGGFAACTALVGKGINDVVEEGQAQDEARAKENTASCEGQSYPDQQPENDRCADASGKVVLDNVAVTATPLKSRRNELCSDVTYVNSTDETISFNVFDWKLQLPSGEVKDAFDSISADNNLGSGDLVKGGTKSGAVCFEVDGSGQFVFIYKPSFWSDTRGIWINTT